MVNQPTDIISLEITWECPECASQKKSVAPASNLKVLKSGIEEPSKCGCGADRYNIVGLRQVDYSPKGEE